MTSSTPLPLGELLGIWSTVGERPLKVETLARGWILEVIWSVETKG